MTKKSTASILALTILIVLTFTLSSCLSVDRQIKINTDGSGEETMRITFLKEFYSIMSSMSEIMDSTRRQSFLDSLYSDQIFLNKTRESYDTIPGINILDIHTERGLDSSNTFVIKYQFDSVSKLGQSLGQLKDSTDKSVTTVEFFREGRDHKFLYSYVQGTPLTEDVENDSLIEQMQNSLAQMFGAGNVSIQIEFPYDVVSSNATSTNGNILTWNYPMSEVFMKSRMDLEALMK